MNYLSRLLKQLHQIQKAPSVQDLLEYALLGVLMSFGVVGSPRGFATGVTGILTNFVTTISPSA